MSQQIRPNSSMQLAKKEKKQSVGDHQLLAGGTTLTFKTGLNV